MSAIYITAVYRLSMANSDDSFACGSSSPWPTAPGSDDVQEDLACSFPNIFGLHLLWRETW